MLASSGKSQTVNGDARTLDVYLHDHLAGKLTQLADGSLSFYYCRDYLNDGSAPAISVAMPLREQPYQDRFAKPYFSGLLPDERARQRLASALGLSDGNSFGLLEVIGGECAGALSLLPTDRSLLGTETPDAEPLDEFRLADTLRLLRAKPLLGGERGVRLSLAGAQDKLAVCLLDNQIFLPQDGQPTTHILKPFIEGLDGTVENELFCMKLAARVGLPVPAVQMRSVAEIPYILVERYDRIRTKDQISRIHQEDFCQALSVPPELKYEEEGGPGTTQSLALLQHHAAQPAADRLKFLRFVIFHYLVGNADAHAKNHALLYRSAGSPQLAPLYDVVCTAAYPNLSSKQAMAIGGRNKPDTIQRQHWLSLVHKTRSAEKLLLKDMQNLASAVRREAADLYQELNEQGIEHVVLSKIGKVIETRAIRLLKLAGD